MLQSTNANSILLITLLIASVFLSFTHAQCITEATSSVIYCQDGVALKQEMQLLVPPPSGFGYILGIVAYIAVSPLFLAAMWYHEYSY